VASAGDFYDVLHKDRWQLLLLLLLVSLSLLVQVREEGVGERSGGWGRARRKYEGMRTLKRRKWDQGGRRRDR
jgi:hypothetical protein